MTFRQFTLWSQLIDYLGKKVSQSTGSLGPRNTEILGDLLNLVAAQGLFDLLSGNRLVFPCPNPGIDQASKTFGGKLLHQS